MTSPMSRRMALNSAWMAHMPSSRLSIRRTSRVTGAEMSDSCPATRPGGARREPGNPFGDSASSSTPSLIFDSLTEIGAIIPDGAGASVFVVALDPELRRAALISSLRGPVKERVVAEQRLQPTGAGLARVVDH